MAQRTNNELNGRANAGAFSQETAKYGISRDAVTL